MSHDYLSKESFASVHLVGSALALLGWFKSAEGSIVERSQSPLGYPR